MIIFFVRLQLGYLLIFLSIIFEIEIEIEIEIK